MRETAEGPGFSGQDIGSIFEYPEYRSVSMYREYNNEDIPPVDRKEALRYAGIPAVVLRKTFHDELKQGEVLEGEDEYAELIGLLDETIARTEGHLTFRVSYLYAPVLWDGADRPILPFPQESRAIARNLSGCRGVILFAATIGAGIDRLIRRYERTEPACGALLQAIGAERAEALCDVFNQEIRTKAEEHGFFTRPRFSPGFADLPLSVQPEILALTDAGRKLGITLNASLLMAPSKSVTGLIGIG